MIIKIVLLLAVIYYLYKIFGGKLELKRREKAFEKYDNDTLVECTQCNILVTFKEVKIWKKKYFVCPDCAKDL